MRNFLQDQRGVTLLETLLAITITVTVVISTVAVLFVGEGSTQYLLKWGDRTQQLRIAMKQMADDLAYAEAYEGTDSETNGVAFAVRGYQPYTNKVDWDWTGLDDWPGDLKAWPEVLVRYELQNGYLIREVQDGGIAHSRQILAGSLIPYNAGLSGSYLQYERLDDPANLTDQTSYMMKVMLRTEREKAGVNSIASTYAEMSVRQVHPPTP